jgi:hypothetical protein
MCQNSQVSENHNVSDISLSTTIHPHLFYQAPITTTPSEKNAQK